MASLSYLLLVFHLLLLINHPSTTTATTSTTTNLYFSKATLFSDYQNMLTNLKIFIYPPPPPQVQQQEQDNTSIYSMFYNSLLSSPFVTNNSNDATLFFVPFPPLSTRSLARHLEYVRTSYPHWSPSLGADHFYFSCHGVGRTSTRDVVELKKNSIRVSCFPSPAREFIPHKDITFPPTLVTPRALKEGVPTRFLGYWRFTMVQSGLELINGLRGHNEFMIESKPSDEEMYLERVQSSKYCLFVYDEGEGMKGWNVALAHGCVPILISDRAIQDLPLMDLIRWSEIALFVKSNIGQGELKRVLMRACEDGAYEKMRGLGMAAAHHFAWNEASLQPYDAFHMVMYQLWRRRHAIRYATWQVESL